MKARLRITSLSTQLVMAAIATSAITFAAFVTLTFVRLEKSFERQSVELGRLSEQKLTRKLEGGARLAGARMEMLFSRWSRALDRLGQQSDIVRAAKSHDGVDLLERLGRAAQFSDIDGIIVVDAKMRVIGASDIDNALSATNHALQAHPLGARVMALLNDNDRRTPTVLREQMRLDRSLAEAIRAKSFSSLSFIGVQPLFDEFGDVFAALIAHRAVRPNEPTLEEFSRLEGTGLLVLDADRVISWADVDNPAVTLSAVAGRDLLQTSDGMSWSRCTDLFAAWRICALAPIGELGELRDDLMRIGEAEGRGLARWLLLIGVVSMIVFAGGTLVAARQIAKPLERITLAVRAVARGDWKSQVVGSDRADEVGDIARAVVVLQRSMEERDRLRSDVAQAEEVKKRREMLEAAIRRFDRVMRSVLLSVSESVETMDETARDLARMSAVAQGEAVEAAFVSEHTEHKVSNLREATEELQSSITETADRIRQAIGIVRASDEAIGQATHKVTELARVGSDMDRTLDAIGEVSSRVSALVLKTTLEAARLPSEGGVVEIAAEVQDLVDLVNRARQDAGRSITSVRNTSQETLAAVSDVAQKLDFVLQQARTIMLAVERQDAATREITDNMSIAATGTLNVSASVDRLKETIEDARGTSVKVVGKAGDMADEALRLDSTVKSFLREVTS